MTADLPRLRLTGASAHNLRDVSVEIPLGRLVAITGVSGSGKTTLVRDILLPRLLARVGEAAGAGDAAEEEAEDQSDREGGPVAGVLTGAEGLGAAVLVDQSALGRTPRSNPAVYIGAFEDIRDVFASTGAARERGLNSSAFSFNSAVGQCERCRGAGFEKIEMQFLSDVFIRCPECQGRRYRPHILEVQATSGGRSWSIADLLEAPVEEALGFLEGLPDSKAARRAVGKLRLLCDVGLGYLRVGQPINTLSGGESQRLKLVSHLAGSAAESLGVGRVPAALAAKLGPDALAVLQRAQRPTLFVFDEPTTGLHFEDVRVLLAVFQRIVEAGHSVLVIEHNLDVIKSADWVIDLGPEAGDQGGRVVAAGPPEEVARVEASHTGRFLRELFGRGPAS